MTCAGDQVKGVKRVDSAALLTLLFLSLLFFYDLFAGRYLLTERDLSAYFIPPRFFWVESIQQGDFPLWNPYQFCGHPFFANPQYGILYPVNVLFFLLPFDIAFNGIIILHFFLGGLFTYLFLRDLKIDPAGSLIAGLVFMLSGYLLSVHSLLPTLLTVVWTPLILLFFRRSLVTPGLRNDIITAACMTISFFGGGLENVYGNVMILFLMAVFYDGTPITVLHRIQRALIVIAMFMGLSAIQMVPFLELFYYSRRGGGLSFIEATTWSFAPRDFILFFLHDAFGYFLDKGKYWSNQCWIKTLYSGGLPFILSALFFFRGTGRRFYAALIIFSLFLSLGQYNPLYYYFFTYIPLFSGLRYPVKFLYIFILVLSITAGLGFQYLKERSQRVEKKAVTTILIFFSLISGLILLLLVQGHAAVAGFLKQGGFDFPLVNYIPVNLYHAKRFFFYCTLFFLMLGLGYHTQWKRWAQAALLIVLAADLLGNMGFYNREKTADYFQKTVTADTMTADKGMFRTFTTGKTLNEDTTVLIPYAPSVLDLSKEKHLPPYNMLYRLHDVWGLDVVRLKRPDDLYKLFIGSPSVSATNLIDLYGIKYVVSITPLENDPRFELVYARIEGIKAPRDELIRKNTIKLYRNRNPFPRAWLAKNFTVLNKKEILSVLAAKAFYPDRNVILEEHPQWDSKSVPAGSAGGPVQGTAAIVSETNNQLRLRVTAPENTLLVLSDTYYPGWKAYVYPVKNNLPDKAGGKQKKILQADYNFRALALEAGEYEVRFCYDPISFKIGAVISLFTVMGSILWFWIKSRAARHRIGRQ